MNNWMDEIENREIAAIFEAWISEIEQRQPEWTPCVTYCDDDEPEFD